ncbi:MAG TPA: hypothetical protein G4O05_04610, partial [Caldilineae bacterium]|nr:hypothetical protein [Caldilineae bacterium]
LIVGALVPEGRFLRRITGRLPVGLSLAGRGPLAKVYAAVTGCGRRAVLSAFGVSVVFNIINVLINWLCGQAVGAGIGLGYFFAATPLLSVSGLVPSIGGWGVRETVSTAVYAPTGAGVLLVEPDGETAFIIAPGANLTLRPQDVEARLGPLIDRVDGLLFNFETPEEALLRAVSLARKADVPIFVDAGPPRPYGRALWQDADVLSPNQPETEALVGFLIDSDEAARAAASALLSQGPRAVVLKLGARGALLATSDAMRFFPAFPVRPVATARHGAMSGPTRIDVETLLAQHPSFDPNADH